MVKTIAKECKTNLFTINGPEIISPIVGETEGKLRSIFEEASIASQTSPTIIFIDEIVTLIIAFT